ncbi:MAG: hypothetical protein ACHP84_10355 [Caulobacterales bacterium]
MADHVEVAAADRLDAETVRRLCGDILDNTVVAIVETGADIADLECAIAFINGESDAMGEEGRTLSGAAGAIYDLLTTEQAAAEER